MYERYLNEYPWLKTENLYTGKVDENYCALDDLPEGWVKAFGDMFVKELDVAIKKANLSDEFYVEQAKEKYGCMRFYESTSNHEIREIIERYSVISENVCAICGRPDTPLLDKIPWIQPICKNCYSVKLKYTSPDEYDELHSESGRIQNSYKTVRFSKKEKIEEIHYIKQTADRIRRKFKKENE